MYKKDTSNRQINEYWCPYIITATPTQALAIFSFYTSMFIIFLLIFLSNVSP